MLYSALLYHTAQVRPKGGPEEEEEEDNEQVHKGRQRKRRRGPRRKIEGPRAGLRVG